MYTFNSSQPINEIAAIVRVAEDIFALDAPACPMIQKSRGV